MQARPIFTLGLLALALAACASKPTQFHTLDPSPPAGAVAGGSMALPIQVDSVTLPPELDRPELVRRSGPGNLDVADIDRWAGPLDQRTALRREEHIDIPAASADIGGTVSGMSRALGVLADRIAAAARSV